MAQTYPGQSTTSQARDTIERAGDAANRAGGGTVGEIESKVAQHITLRVCVVAISGER